MAQQRCPSGTDPAPAPKAWLENQLTVVIPPGAFGTAWEKAGQCRLGYCALVLVFPSSPRFLLQPTALEDVLLLRGGGAVFLAVVSLKPQPSCSDTFARRKNYVSFGVTDTMREGEQYSAPGAMGSCDTAGEAKCLFNKMWTGCPRLSRQVPFTGGKWQESEEGRCVSDLPTVIQAGSCALHRAHGGQKLSPGVGWLLTRGFARAPDIRNDMEGLEPRAGGRPGVMRGEVEAGCFLVTWLFAAARKITIDCFPRRAGK